MSRIKFLSLSLALVAGVLIYQNCGPVAFNAIPPTTGNITGTTASIIHFQPALAVRDISCLACHANVQANVITDFGASDPWFMGGFQNPTDFGSYHYMATTWQTMDQIAGQVIVPEATVPDTFVQPELQSGSTAPPGPVSLASYLQLTDMNNFGGSWYSYFGEPTPATMSFTNNVMPSAGTPPVISEPNIYIGAPTQSEILAIVNNSAAGPWIQVVGATTTGLSGLSIVTGVNNQMYVSNSGPVQCSGKDVVINGTLLLNNAQLYAEKGGCRLYVTGSVFIEGPVTYMNSGASSDGTDNIQITSATSIIMGVGLNGAAWNGDGSPDSNDSPLKVRLLDDVRSNMLFRNVTTSAAYSTYANSILNEGLNIGPAYLQDASIPGSLPTAPSAAKQQRASINFNHILLNAPLIHSRYMGAVNGVIVAESAEFSLGEFVFNYDPVFQNVPVLPALPYDILCTSATCTPTSP